MTIFNIQAARGIAAVTVVITHVCWMIPGRPNEQYYWASGFGVAAVDLFFVISGWVMAMTMHRLFEDTRPRAVKAADFALRRAARIYPPFWIVFFLTIALLPLLGTRPSMYGWLAEFFVLAPWGAGIVPVAWSLTYEIAFYAICSVCLLALGRQAIVGAAVVVTTFVFATLFIPAPATPMQAPLMLEFVAGLLLSQTPKAPKWVASMILVLALLWFVPGTRANMAFGEWNGWSRLALVGIPAVAIIYALVQLEGSIHVPRVVTALGDGSYAVYIWHMLFLVILQKIGLISGGYDSAVLGAILSVAGGMLMWRLVEIPLRSQSKRLIDGLVFPRLNTATH